MCNLLLWQEIHNSKMNTRQELYNSAVRLSEHFSPKSCRLLLLAIIFGICAIAITGKSVSAETSPRIQLLDGFLGDEQGIVYTLADLKKGDTVYANMKGISGNLDPMLGMFRKDSHPDFQYDDVSEFIANSDVNLVDAFSQFASDKFIVWDDDGGQGYAARLKFSVPADGDYRILAGSMITYLSFGSLTPTFTTGTYRLSLGLNTPDVETGKGEPTGELIAIVEKRTTKSSSHVQNYEQKFTVDKQFAVHQLRNLKPGDTLYVRVVSPKDHPPLRLLLTDFIEDRGSLGEGGPRAKEQQLPREPPCAEQDSEGKGPRAGGDQGGRRETRDGRHPRTRQRRGVGDHRRRQSYRADLVRRSQGPRRP